MLGKASCEADTAAEGGGRANRTVNRRAGADSHKCNDGHVANQEEALGEDSSMCAGEWL